MMKSGESEKPSAQTRRFRDADIRAALTCWLLDQHRDEQTALYEEFAIPRPTARADIALVNGSFVGYEIKSDVDSIARLNDQVRSYDQVFDKIYLVTTLRRMPRFKDAVPSSWGILCIDEDEKFKFIRRARINRQVNCENVLYLLRVAELRYVASQLGISVSNLKKPEIIEKISKGSARKHILRHFRQILKNRQFLS